MRPFAFAKFMQPTCTQLATPGAMSLTAVYIPQLTLYGVRSDDYGSHSDHIINDEITESGVWRPVIWRRMSTASLGVTSAVIVAVHEHWPRARGRSTVTNSTALFLLLGFCSRSSSLIRNDQAITCYPLARKAYSVKLLAVDITVDARYLQWCIETSL